MKSRILFAAGALACLAGCGGAGSANSSAAMVGAAGAWNETDACATLGKDKAGAAFGKPITATTLDGVHDASENGIAMSMCTFTAGDGSHFTVLLRRIQSGDTTNDHGIADIRSGGGIAGPSVDLHDLPGTLLWQNTMGTLTWFPDDKRMAVVTVARGYAASALTDDQRKAASIAIAKALP